jgi:energy-coupling factor transport system substrate-specific component
MKSKSIWSFNLSVAALVLIPVAIGINYVGKLFAGVLKLPLWLDSIGTTLASMLAGPIVGGISGLVNNIIYGLTVDPISFVYALTNLAIGLVVGAIAFNGWVTHIGKAIVLGIIVGCTAVVISTPLNIIFWGGQTGNLWGDAVYTFFMAKGTPVWIASLFDEIVVDLPDKIIVVLISYGICKGLPKNMTRMFNQSQSVEKL